MILTGIAIGLAGGFLGGLLGVGGGVIMVPLQVLLLRVRQLSANATSLVAIIPIAIAGGLVYYFRGKTPLVDLGFALCLVLGSMAGAPLGARIANSISDRRLRLVVAAVLALVAVKELIWPVLSLAPSGVRVTVGLRFTDLPIDLLVAGIGFGVGILSGLMGVGGGILLVPIMVIGLGFPQQLAQGTSLAAVIPTSLSGAISHLRYGNVMIRNAVLLGLGGMLGALAGGLFAVQLPASLLGRLFGLVLLYSAYRTAPRTIWSDFHR